MKKWICLTLAALLLASVCGCAPKAPPTTGTVSRRAPLAAMDSAVLFRREGVTVTALALEQTAYGGEIRVEIDNKSDKNIAIAADDLVVNGLTVTDGYSVEAGAGQKAQGVIRVSYGSLDAAGMTDIAWIASPDARILDTDTCLALWDAPFEIRTRVYGTYRGAVPEEGAVCYGDDSITVTALGIVRQGAAVKVRLRIRNRTDGTLALKVTGVTAGGAEGTAWMFDTVYGGTDRFCEFLLDDPDGGISSVSFALQVYGLNGHYVLLYTTDTMTAAREER